MTRQSGINPRVLTVLATLAVFVTMLPAAALAQGCCVFSSGCADFNFPGAEQECGSNNTFTPLPATCATGCVPIAANPLPPVPSETQLNLSFSSRPAGGEPRPFFIAGEAAPFEVGINAVRGTAQLYRAVVFLEGFALALPAPFQEAGRLQVSLGPLVTSFPLRVLNTTTLWADVNGNGQFDGTEPTIVFRQGSIIMLITVPFGGDGDPATHDVQADGRVTITGTFLRPVTPGMHPVRGILTTVDPDTGGPDDGAGVAPRTIVIDRTVEIQASPNRAPVCAAAQASPARLWPANHKLVWVGIVGVTDGDNDPVTLTVTRVTQDEPVTGLGDGDTSPDAVIQGHEVMLRAERSGKGNGRVYRVSFTANDGRGGSCTGAVDVCVPHDNGKKSTCVDDGQLYPSTQP